MKRTTFFLALLSLGVTALAQTKIKFAPLSSEPPESVKAELDITHGRMPEQELKLDVYRPKSGGDELPACVPVHGSAWKRRMRDSRKA